MGSFPKKSFELYPSEGLGFLTLGHSLFQTYALLKKHGLHNDIRFIYSNSSKTTVLQLTRVSINLIFESAYQKLILIEVNEVGKVGVEFTFKNEPIGSLSFKHIYNRLFGPTYPGVENPASNSYCLSYPGIAFRFSLDQLSENQNKDDLNRVLNSSKKDVNCSSFTIFKGDNWTDAVTNINKILDTKNLQERYSLLPSLYPKASENVKRQILYARINNLSAPNLEIYYKSQQKASFHLELGTTSMRNVLGYLGSPDDTFLKNGDSRISSKSEKFNVYKVHNYYRYGIDCFYKMDESSVIGSAVLSKVTLHTNIENSLDFLKYEKINVEVNKISYNHQYTWNTTEAFDRMYEFLSPQSKDKSVFLNRKDYELNSFSTTNNEFEMIGYDDNVESSTSAENESSCSTNPEETDDYKNWGLTKLVGDKHYVFEVLLDGNKVSSVTVVQ